MTRKERLIGALTLKLDGIDLSRQGVVLEPEDRATLLESIAAQVVEVWRPTERIIHEIGPDAMHRLVIDGHKTAWKLPNEIARHANYIATTDAFMGTLPQIARLSPVESTHFDTRAVQTLEE